jgi:hypothetical protein
MGEMLEGATPKTASYPYSSDTRTSYAEQVQRGKEHFKKLNNDELKEAFNGLSEQTQTALLVVIAYKTAEAIRSAFKQYFRDTLNCQGDIRRRDMDSGSGSQCSNHITTLKKQYGCENQTRQSLPMSYKDLTTITEHPQWASQR